MTLGDFVKFRAIHCARRAHRAVDGMSPPPAAEALIAALEPLNIHQAGAVAAAQAVVEPANVPVPVILVEEDDVEDEQHSDRAEVDEDEDLPDLTGDSDDDVFTIPKQAKRKRGPKKKVTPPKKRRAAKK